MVRRTVSEVTANKQINVLKLPNCHTKRYVVEISRAEEAKLYEEIYKIAGLAELLDYWIPFNW